MIFTMSKSLTIIEEAMMGLSNKGDRMTDYIPTPAIGEILKEEFMEPMNLSAYRLAKELHVPVSRIQAILHNRRKITADTSLRLAKFFGVSDRYFLDLQSDLDIRELKISMEKEIADIHPISVAAI